MSIPPKQTDIADNEIAFYFVTNAIVPASLVARFVGEVEKIALSQRYLGAGGQVEIVEIRRGSVMARLALYATIAGAPLSAAQVGLAIADKIQRPSGPVATCAAKMVVEYGVVAAHVITCQGSTQILRDMMPAVGMYEENSRPAKERLLVEPQRKATLDIKPSKRLSRVPEEYLGRNEGLEAADLSAFFEPPPYSEDLRKMKGFFQRGNGDVVNFITRNGSRHTVDCRSAPQFLFDRAEQAEVYYSADEGHRLRGIVWLKN